MREGECVCSREYGRELTHWSGRKERDKASCVNWCELALAFQDLVCILSPSVPCCRCDLYPASEHCSARYAHSTPASALLPLSLAASLLFSCIGLSLDSLASQASGQLVSEADQDSLDVLDARPSCSQDGVVQRPATLLAVSISSLRIH